MVTYISIQLAYFMGFTDVYLIAIDFDYALTTGHNPINHSTEHPQDHFTPEYFKPGETRYLPQLELARRAMKCAKEFYEIRGRKIWNCTRGGKLEIFDRIPFDDVIAN
jgi:hypothetical protein